MPPDLSTEQRARLERVRGHFETAEQMLHRRLRSRWEELYKLYRTYQDSKEAVPPGVDYVAESAGEWGSNLHIPYSFANVETIVPRMLSNRPRGLILPRDEQAVQNCEYMRITIDAQQDQIRYPLTCQTTAKSGQIYGLGVQKATWRRTERQRNRLVPATGVNDFEWAVEPERRVLHDDPYAEDVDIFDFIWDPYAADMQTAEWVIHRTWRPLRYVLARLGINPEAETPDWDLADGWTREDIQNMGSGDKYTEVWRERMAARGLSNFETRGDQIHEVWEFHDGNRVITILDRELPVRDIENPAWHGDLPFHIYRPSEIPHEFCGIGAIEPARYLQYEMDLLRSQRRDYASMALSPTFTYQDGSIDPAHFVIRPGGLIPTLGDPKDLLHQVRLMDVPQSGYAEEDRIRADIERATGLSDAVMGAQSSQTGTATEAQLQLAAANVRVQNMTYRFEVETIEGVINQWVEMNQQNILTRRPRARQVPAYGEPDRRWAWQIDKIGPEELQGLMLYTVRGGSTAPENIPQDRNDAQMYDQLLGQHPDVDQRRLLIEKMEKLGIKHPESMLLPERHVPPETLDIALEGFAEMAGQIGADPDEFAGMAKEILAGALEQAKNPQAPQAGQEAQ